MRETRTVPYSLALSVSSGWYATVECKSIHRLQIALRNRAPHMPMNLVCSWRFTSAPMPYTEDVDVRCSHVRRRR